MRKGELIKKYRKQAGLTQQELANLVGISKNGLWNYENNKREISVELLKRIADVLRVPISELIGIKVQDGTHLESITFDSWKNTYTSAIEGSNIPIVTNGKINDMLTLSLLYDLYERIYSVYNLENEHCMTAMDFFYSNENFASNLLSNVSSTILGEIINSSIAIAKSEAVKRETPYLVPYLTEVSSPASPNLTTVHKYEIGRKHLTLDYVKHEIWIKLIRITKIPSLLKDYKKPNEPIKKLNVSEETIFEISDRVKEIHFIENE